MVQYLEEQGLKYPSPMLRVCRKLKIPIFYVPLDPLDGCFFRNKITKRTVILINEKSNAKRQHFSVAHELGHVVLGHPSGAFLGMRAATQEELYEESEANAFASELLMPKAILKAKGPMTAKALARYCHVSITAATIKVKQLGWE